MIDPESTHVWKETYTGQLARDPEAVDRILAALQELLVGVLPALNRELNNIANALPVRRGDSLKDAIAISQALRMTREFAKKFAIGVFELNLDDSAHSLAPARGGVMRRAFATLFKRQYRQAKRALMPLAIIPGSAAELLDGVESAQAVAHGWHSTLKTHRSGLAFWRKCPATARNRSVLAATTSPLPVLTA